MKTVTSGKQKIIFRQLTILATLALSTGLFWSAATYIDAVSQPALAQTEWITSWVNDLKHSNQRWIQVDISGQRLTAWQGGTAIASFVVSTGRNAEPTPTGVFEIQSMHRTARMQGDTYDIPDVPYTMYYSGSYAIHGTYWHSDFGSPISNGCINVATDHAQWLFDWAAIGTPVVVQQ